MLTLSDFVLQELKPLAGRISVIHPPIMLARARDAVGNYFHNEGLPDPFELGWDVVFVEEGKRVMLMAVREDERVGFGELECRMRAVRWQT